MVAVRGPRVVPITLPAPIPSASAPRQTFGERPPSGCTRTRNAPKKSMKPESQRSAAADCNACRTSPAIVASPTRPPVEGCAATAASFAAAAGLPSAAAGNLVVMTAATTYTIAPNNSSVRWPSAVATATATLPAMAGAMTPTSVSRELAWTSVIEVGHEARHRSAASNPIGLAGDKDPERGRIERQGLRHAGRVAVGQAVADHQREDGSSKHGDRQCDPAAAAEAVEYGAEHRCHERERQHRHEQVERYAAACLMSGHGEKQRAGQGDRDGCVARRLKRVHLDQRGQSGSACAISPVPATQAPQAVPDRHP